MVSNENEREKIASCFFYVLGSQLNCFSKGNVTLGLRERFHLNMTDEQLEFNVEKMVESSLNSLTTRVYDTFQYYTNGISK
jgi:phosphatidylinositol 4-kinase